MRSIAAICVNNDLPASNASVGVPPTTVTASLNPTVSCTIDPVMMLPLPGDAVIPTRCGAVVSSVTEP